MPPELIAWLLIGFAVLVGLHELTHVVIARCHGHPTVCIAINPIGVAVVFEDTPRARYWLSQVVLPAVVSWAVCYVWLYVLFTYPSQLQVRMPVEQALAALPAFVTLLTILTSGGDLFSAIIEMRTPIWGDERIHRDFEVLRKVPNLVLFTAHGRERWQAVWTELKAKRAVAAPALH